MSPVKRQPFILSLDMLTKQWSNSVQKYLWIYWKKCTTDLFRCADTKKTGKLSKSLLCLILQWRHNERDCVSNHRRLDYLHNRLLRHRSKHQSSVSLAFVRGFHRWPVDSPLQRATYSEMFSFDDVITKSSILDWIFSEKDTDKELWCLFW